jgi:hypothetical protein
MHASIRKYKFDIVTDSAAALAVRVEEDFFRLLVSFPGSCPTWSSTLGTGSRSCHLGASLPRAIEERSAAVPHFFCAMCQDA